MHMAGSNADDNVLFADLPSSAFEASSPRTAPPATGAHHALNHDAIQTWIFPTNVGAPRDYQYNIVSKALYQNVLVALPTGLGKTFIAATVMLNWLRWTKDAQIVFVAPTKPLVAQQVDACLNTVGIPRSQTVMLTGGISPGLRAEQWSCKRVFFMTPQTIINDLKAGICDPKKIVLLIVDEAHRATGSYAYVEVVKFIRRFNQHFRVLALTATPGSSVETVQEVIDGLDISKVEIRTELSIDIQQYVYNRNIETVLFDNSEELEAIIDLFSQSVRPILAKLHQFNAYWSKDPMQLSAYGLTKARRQWMASSAGRSSNMGVKGMINRIFSVLASLAHGVDLLKYHGIGPFLNSMRNFSSSAAAGKSAKYEREILEHSSCRQMMSLMQGWMRKPDFLGHPKLEFLQSVVMNHFLDNGQPEERNRVSRTEPDHSVPETSNTTRIMIFAHFRDSAEEIVRILSRHHPTVRPHVFVGQAASKGSEGMDQKQQLGIIRQFKSGEYNTLVATSIGEEGLDIGEVDLIICYDSSASPIRMLQRMGRTGRKRAGQITLLLMKGKEEESFAKAKDNYQKVQQMIASGTRFVLHSSSRILPKNVKPTADMRVVDIPIENSQETGLPEPKLVGARAPKRPPKKFHMPDGVETGFLTAARLYGPQASQIERPKRRGFSKLAHSHALPPMSEVVLTPAEERDLERLYRNIPDKSERTISAPRIDGHAKRQRALGPTKHIIHGQATTRFVNMLNEMHELDEAELDRWRASSYRLEVSIEDADSLEPYASSQKVSIPDYAPVESSDAELPDLLSLMRSKRAQNTHDNYEIGQRTKRNRRILGDSSE